ncbi:hypothetical protein PMAL9190_01487 [Photobacterium malacitanum]|uniref:Uncharacterized protein n=1 Tax=Photobacterium malacitanum TaxID=2204294 RepID=A0A1Y6MC53_9GAMM|nr:hypothetical protein [Photobacterium malacitanum]SMY34082.1 hypothetical protein PMAL9190_01487 [Photobacterium malacitanum]
MTKSKTPMTPAAASRIQSSQGSFAARAQKAGATGIVINSSIMEWAINSSLLS